MDVPKSSVLQIRKRIIFIVFKYFLVTKIQYQNYHFLTSTLYTPQSTHHIHTTTRPPHPHHENKSDHHTHTTTTCPLHLHHNNTSTTPITCSPHPHHYNLSPTPTPLQLIPNTHTTICPTHTHYHTMATTPWPPHPHHQVSCHCRQPICMHIPANSIRWI